MAAIQVPRSALAAVMLLAVGCELPTTPVGPALGLISFEGSWVEGTPRFSTLGQFFRSPYFDPELFATDYCQYVLLYGERWDYVPDDRVGIPAGAASAVSPYLRAGDHLVVRSDLHADTLPYLSVVGRPEGYAPIATEFLDLTPGDSVTVSVAGEVGGFPEAEVGIRIAEPFEGDTVPTPSGESALSVAWDPAPNPGSRMLVFLEFHSVRPPVLALGAANTLLVCSFPDTGTAQVHGDWMEPWRASWPNRRSFDLARVRYTKRVLPGGVEFHAVSTMPSRP